MSQGAWDAVIVPVGLFSPLTQPNGWFSDEFLIMPEPAPTIRDVFAVRGDAFLLKDGVFFIGNDCSCCTEIVCGCNNTDNYSNDFNSAGAELDWHYYTNPDPSVTMEGYWESDGALKHILFFNFTSYNTGSRCIKFPSTGNKKVVLEFTIDTCDAFGARLEAAIILGETSPFCQERGYSKIIALARSANSIQAIGSTNILNGTTSSFIEAGGDPEGKVIKIEIERQLTPSFAMTAKWYVDNVLMFSNDMSYMSPYTLGTAVAYITLGTHWNGVFQTVSGIDDLFFGIEDI